MLRVIMMTALRATALAAVLSCPLSAATYYVDQDHPHPAPTTLPRCLTCAGMVLVQFGRSGWMCGFPTNCRQGTCAR